VTVAGGCLCGEVSYQVNRQFDKFFVCHCRQCQQLTGSAFAANIFVSEEAHCLKAGLSGEKFDHFPE